MKAHMICHTHWDREWYSTKEVFRTKLVRLIDGILDIIDTDPDFVSFMLDGQTIAIEDYLEIKPYNKQKLFDALRSGKIICGPWYVLPDELLVSGEAHIRNYMMGTKVISESGRKMKAAYLPDSFGHPSQMPQIINGLGMDTMVFWRGVTKDMKSTEFYWESPCSKSKILCVHMPHGYGNCGNLNIDMEETVPRLKNLLANLGARTSTDLVLLMNGSDHLTQQNNIAEIVKAINEYIPEYHVELSTMETFINDLKAELIKCSFGLKTYTGEFRSGDCSMLLGGTLSTRMYLKQRNDCIQKKMEKYLEPVLAGEFMLNLKDGVRGYGDYIWKKILENHPHDSICGCSIDEVHQEMMTRFQCLEQLLNTLLSDSIQRIQAMGLTGKREASERLFLFEPSQDKIRSYAEAEIILDRTLVQAVNYTRSVIEDYEAQIRHPGLPEGLIITDEVGREIPYVILESEKAYDTLYQDHTMPEIYKANKVKVGMLLPEFEYGFHQLHISKSPDAGPRLQISNSNTIENEFYRIRMENAEVIVFDKRTGRIHHGVGTITDQGDAGDEYTYSWPETDKTYKMDAGNIELLCKDLPGIGATLFIKGKLLIPEGLRADRKERSDSLMECPVEMQVTLTNGVDRIDFCLTVDNKAKDHRLQVQLPSGIKTSVSEASDIFHVTKRPVDIEIPEEWMEYPQAAHPTHGFINLEDEEYGMSVSAIGLTEYEAKQLKDQTVVNLTLLRCVGWLSRTDLLTRKGNGGWTIETTEAQCIGCHQFEFSVSYHEGSWKHHNRFGLMEKHRLPSYICTINNLEDIKTDHKNPLRFLSQLPGEMRISAFKISESGRGAILRIYNISDDGKSFDMNIPDYFSTASYVNLNEDWLEDIEMDGRIIRLSVHGSEIKTVYFGLSFVN